jgi:DNA-directed RNA polymerase subunit beta'
VPFQVINRPQDKKALSNLIDTCYRLGGDKETVVLADRMRTLGFTHAMRAGISICVDDMVIPLTKDKYLSSAQKLVEEIHEQYAEGLITEGERYNKIIDIWAKVAEEIAKEMMEGISKTTVIAPDGKEERVPSANPIWVMADSGARGSAQQIRQLAAMRGLMAKPSGEIIEQPITANFREGLSVLQYFISTHGARKGLADTALKTANSGYLTRRLVDVAQDAVVTEPDCGADTGIWMTPLVEAGEVIEPLGERILGRAVLNPLLDPVTNELIVDTDELIDENLVTKIELSGIERIEIRSVLTCQAKRGVCGKCYGRDLARGRTVNIGEAVGVIAAQSIGEPGTQLTMRTFHVGGIAKATLQQSALDVRNEGTIKLTSVALVTRRDGKRVVMNRNSHLTVIDDTGRERESYPLVYGAALLVNHGDRVQKDQRVAEWDPFSIPILTEVGGTIKYHDIEAGTTMKEDLDSVTGLSRKIITESKYADKRPGVVILDERKKPVKIGVNEDQEARYFFPINSTIVVEDEQEIGPGDVLAKIPRESQKTKDITGGLPRVAELFEARKPKEHAIISEIDGVVSFGKDTKGKRKVTITPEYGDPRDYLISKGKHISVHEGDQVKAGEPLMEGAANPHDILRVLGEKELAKYLVDEIQEVYRLQGVKINDKHIEVIVRQMLRRVRIKDVGDTEFLIDEQVEKHVVEEVNRKLEDKAFAEGKELKSASWDPLLLGITKASLSTESFISASSFQETTKVLTEAAITGKTDYLSGLKENVIMGRLIPAGTGLPQYKRMTVLVEGEPVEPIQRPEQTINDTPLPMAPNAE